ncbi:MAG TPA: hypothetical protein VIM08_03030 [Arthrobacter sp.]|jgi:hypothetical protein
MAERGGTWLVRRAERLYGPRLGRLQHSELSWNISWHLLPWFVAAGFFFGAIAEFTGQPTSSRGPGMFSNVPLYIAASVLTGLIMWSLTLLWSFRRLLVFDRGLLYRYSQKHAARAILWQDIDAGTLRSVVAPAGPDVDRFLKTRSPGNKTSLGVRGRYAVVFRATDTRLPFGTPTAAGPDSSSPGFFTFTTRESPERLMGMIQRGLRQAGAPGIVDGPPMAPPTVLHTAMSLD